MFHRKELLEIRARLSCIERGILRIEHKLNACLNTAATYVKITQDGVDMALKGTPLGGTSTFTASFLQGQGGAAGTLQAGAIPLWSSTDTNVAITQSADGTQASVLLAATENATSYPLTVTAINSDGATITNTVQVPVLPAVVTPPPPDTAATFIDIEQTS